ncbi:hypothetical protein HU200_055008 [Digitaria exilis]|uniref:Uncharacterized protein n=1 Tax=Digitaria exilis TaxID=1010633 RepID=A0A835ALN7_9POAL|nr:hypothetical protein HU200_055008 [Digitaria exilis]
MEVQGDLWIKFLFFFGGRSKMGRNTRKKIMLNSTYRNVGRYSLGCGTTSG